MAVSTLTGFGVAAILIALLSGEMFDIKLWQAFAFFILSATLLGWVFIALAYVSSVMVSEKSRAAGAALLIWFWFVLVFDMLMLGGLVISKGAAGSDWLAYLLLLNPTDVFRLANLAGFEAVRNYTGLAHVAAGPLFEPAVLTGVLVLWVVGPLSLALWLFNRQIGRASCRGRV